MDLSLFRKERRSTNASGSSWIAADSRLCRPGQVPVQVGSSTCRQVMCATREYRLVSIAASPREPRGGGCRGIDDPVAPGACSP